jgi:hypothetical protein
MLVDGQMAAFQPADASGDTADTLSVALASGQVVLGKQPLLGPSAQVGKMFAGQQLKPLQQLRIKACRTTAGSLDTGKA